MAGSQTPEILAADVPIEEETMPGYDERRFYPANPGDLLHRRYKIVTKLGWGSSSTVWLGKDTSRYGDFSSPALVVAPNVNLDGPGSRIDTSL